MKIGMRARLVALWLLCAVLMAGGCVDLSAVRDFAETSYRTADYTQLVDGYIAAPGQLKRYAPDARKPAFDDEQRARQGQRQGLLALHARVQDYMAALGSLASDGAVDFDKHYAKLEQAIADASFASSPQAAAARQLGDVLTKAATDGWRRRKIAALIEEANEPLQTVLSSLQRIVTKGFAEDLNQEEQTLDHYYAGLKQQSADRAALAAVDEWRETRLATLEHNERLVDTYAKALQAIKEGHQKLYDDRERLATKEVAALVRGYVTELKTLEKTLRSVR